MEGLATLWDLIRFLMLFFGLPVLLLVLPTLTVALLALRALRAPDVAADDDDEPAPRERDGSWSLPVRRERDLAGWWFTVVALLPVLLYNATIALPSWAELLLSSWSAAEAPGLRVIIFLLATSLMPLVGSYAAGARLALPIVRGDSPWWAALGRGACVGAASLLLLFVVVYFDVLTTDYRMTAELTPQGGLAAANGALATLAVPVVAVGALGGWALSHIAQRWTLARSSWVGGRRVARAVR